MLELRVPALLPHNSLRNNNGTNSSSNSNSSNSGTNGNGSTHLVSAFAAASVLLGPQASYYQSCCLRQCPLWGMCLPCTYGPLTHYYQHCCLTTAAMPSVVGVPGHARAMCTLMNRCGMLHAVSLLLQVLLTHCPLPLSHSLVFSASLSPPGGVEPQLSAELREDGQGVRHAWDACAEHSRL